LPSIEESSEKIGYCPKNLAPPTAIALFSVTVVETNEVVLAPAKYLLV